jgi:hypothetical protein
MGKEKIAGGRSVNRFSVEEIGIADMVDNTEEDIKKDDGTKHKK